jgi:hypothetical protein
VFVVEFIMKVVSTHWHDEVFAVLLGTRLLTQVTHISTVLHWLQLTTLQPTQVWLYKVDPLGHTQVWLT